MSFFSSNVIADRCSENTTCGQVKALVDEVKKLNATLLEMNNRGKVNDDSFQQYSKQWGNLVNIVTDKINAE